MAAPSSAVIAAVALAAGGAIAYLMWPSSGGPGVIRLQPGDPEVLAIGEPVYRTHCAACHGERLEGQPNWRQRDANELLPAPPHDATGHTWHHTDDVLFRLTKHGVAQTIGDPNYKTAMPSYEKTLSDAQIIAVLSWIKAQWPAPIRDKHDQINAQAKP